MKVKKPSARVVAASVAALIAVLLFAQSAPPVQVNQYENAALDGNVGVGLNAGGTVKLGGTRYCDSFDPARSYDVWCGVVFRLYSRNLMSFRGQGGKESLATAPDLAIDRPTVSADKTIWTFTLRSNAKWSDGTTITAQDVQHSVRRLFDSNVLGTVNVNYLCLLSNCPKGIPQYRGPYVRSTVKLQSVTIKGSNIIRFRLNAPYVDFDRVLALPQFAVVQRAWDLKLVSRKKTYGDNPLSSGPYKLIRVGPRKNVQFVRNLQWSQDSDPIRNPHVNRFTWKNFKSDALLDRAVINAEIHVRLGDGLGSTGLKILDKKPNLRKRIDNPFTGYVNYFVVSDKSTPLNRLACREAIFYAMDKAELQRLRGGEHLSEIATSLLPPLVDGFDASSNTYPSGKLNKGDIDASRSSLKACGYPDGFEFVIAYLNAGIGPTLVRSVQTSLARVGIVVIPKPFNTFEKFVGVVQNPDQFAASDISMVITGNGSQINSAYDFWSPIVDSRLISAFGNQNLAQIDDQAVNQQLDQLITDPDVRTSTSSDINENVMASAQYLPYAYNKIVLYRSPKLANVYVQQALAGHYDLVNIALATK